MAIVQLIKDKLPKAYTLVLVGFSSSSTTCDLNRCNGKCLINHFPVCDSLLLSTDVPSFDLYECD